VQQEQIKNACCTWRLISSLRAASSRSMADTSSRLSETSFLAFCSFSLVCLYRAAWSSSETSLMRACRQATVLCQ